MVLKKIYYCTHDELLSLTKDDMYKHAKCIYAECAGDAAQEYAKFKYDGGNEFFHFIEAEGFRIWVMRGHILGEKMWWFDVQLKMIPVFDAGEPHEEVNFSKGE